MAATTGRKNHRWSTIQPLKDGGIETICENCRLREQEVWLLDNDGRPTRGLVWAPPQGGVVAVRPFAFSSNYRPEKKPAGRWSEVYRDVPVQGAPECPKTPDAWLD